MSTKKKGLFGRSKKAEEPRSGNTTPLPPERIGSDESLLSTGAFNVSRTLPAPPQSGAVNYSGGLMNSGALNLSGALNQSGSLNSDWRNNGPRGSRPLSPAPVRITANGSVPANGFANGVAKTPPYNKGQNGQASGNFSRRKSSGGASQLLIGIEAESRSVAVDASCSLDEYFYLKNLKRPGLCNVQLKAKQAVADELEQFPARLAMADGVKHVGWLSDRYDSLERDFPNLSWHAVMTVETGLEVPQRLLDVLVQSLYTRQLEIKPATVETLLHIAHILQVPAVTAACADYIVTDLIAKHPAACHELGKLVYPDLHMEEAVLEYFSKLQWDGAISQTMLHSIGVVLERCSDDDALRFVKGLMEPPALVSPLQAASMSAQLPAAKRERLLQGLQITQLSMADVQSLLHWANNRRANRAVLADSAILWGLLYHNITSSLLPLEHLSRCVGPKAAQMKLWDLPLGHIPPAPGRYQTRRSGWLHLEGGRSFCMEAVWTNNRPGSEWGLFCNPDRQHALQPEYTIKLCAIQQNAAEALVQLSPDIKPEEGSKPGLGTGFDELLSKWAGNPQLVWKKGGQDFLTLGLYVDLHLEDQELKAMQQLAKAQEQPAAMQLNPPEPDSEKTESSPLRRQASPPKSQSSPGKPASSPGKSDYTAVLGSAVNNTGVVAACPMPEELGRPVSVPEIQPGGLNQGPNPFAALATRQSTQRQEQI